MFDDVEKVQLDGIGVTESMAWRNFADYDTQTEAGLRRDIQNFKESGYTCREIEITEVPTNRR